MRNIFIYNARILSFHGFIETTLNMYATAPYVCPPYAGGDVVELPPVVGSLVWLSGGGIGTVPNSGWRSIASSSRVLPSGA